MVGAKQAHICEHGAEKAIVVLGLQGKDFQKNTRRQNLNHHLYNRSNGADNEKSETCSIPRAPVFSFNRFFTSYISFRSCHRGLFCKISPSSCHEVSPSTCYFRHLKSSSASTTICGQELRKLCKKFRFFTSTLLLYCRHQNLSIVVNSSNRNANG